MGCDVLLIHARSQDISTPVATSFWWLYYCIRPSIFCTGSYCRITDRKSCYRSSFYSTTTAPHGDHSSSNYTIISSSSSIILWWGAAGRSFAALWCHHATRTLAEQFQYIYSSSWGPAAGGGGVFLYCNNPIAFYFCYLASIVAHHSVQPQSKISRGNKKRNKIFE